MLSKSSSFISRIILIQKYIGFSSKFKMSQGFILAGQNRGMFLCRSTFGSSTIRENYSVSHSLSVSRSARLSFTIWAKSNSTSEGGFSIVHFPLAELVFFSLCFWFWWFPPYFNKGDPPLPLPDQQHLLSMFQSTSQIFKTLQISAPLHWFKKILPHLTNPKASSSVLPMPKFIKVLIQRFLASFTSVRHTELFDPSSLVILALLY